MYVTSFTSSETRAVSMLATLYVVRMLGLFMVLPLIAIYSSDMTGATPFLLGPVSYTHLTLPTNREV